MSIRGNNEKQVKGQTKSGEEVNALPDRPV